MNKVYKYFAILVIGILFASCSKSDNATVPVRDHSEQYTTDIAAIESYLDSHYIEVNSDYDVTLVKIPEGGSQLSIREQKTFPLNFKMVNKNDVDYKVYYLNLREGTQKQPTSIDSVYVTYKGTLLDDTKFDEATTSVWFQLESVVSGWSEIVPFFKSGTFDTAPSPDPVSFEDFGAGVMFLPSGLAYFNSSPSSLVPSYSPLVFSFKLNNVRYKDHDRDKILSKYEVDPAIANQKPSDYDSDGDGVANYLDIDDDNDNYLTKFEILINGSVPSFENILNCSGTTGGTKKHLDATCH